MPLLVAMGVVAVLGTVLGVVWGALRGDGEEPVTDPTVTQTSTVPPDAAASAPRDLTVRAAEGRLELSWSLPDESVTPIVRSQPQAGDMQSMTPGQTSLTLVDVEPGTSYCFTLLGLKKVGSQLETYPGAAEPVCGTPL